MAQPLREALKREFYPFVEARGFVRQRATHPLFTEFRRQRDGMVQVFEIQWDKYQRPRFVLNFQRAEGMQAPSRTARGRLQRRRGGSLACWFGLHKPWLAVLRSGRLHYRPEEVVQELMRSFPELEAWWLCGEEGPHLYGVALPAQASRASDSLS